MFSHQRVRNLSIVTIYFLAYKVKLQIFTPKNTYPFLVGPLECIHTILLYFRSRRRSFKQRVAVKYYRDAGLHDETAT